MNGTGSEGRARPVRPQLAPSLRTSLWDNIDGMMLAIAGLSIFTHVAFVVYLRGIEVRNLRGPGPVSTGGRTEREPPCPGGVCLPPPPPPPVDPVCDPSLVMSALRPRRPALAACYQRALLDNALLGGKLKLRMR